MALSIDSKIGELLDNPQAKAIIDQYLPDFSKSPQLAMARNFTLKMAAGMSGGKITSEILSSIGAALAAL